LSSLGKWIIRKQPASTNTINKVEHFNYNLTIIEISYISANEIN
jgi:hypothetical protein